MPASHSSCPLFAAGESSTGATVQLIENPLLVKSTYLPTLPLRPELPGTIPPWHGSFLYIQLLLVISWLISR